MLSLVLVLGAVAIGVVAALHERRSSRPTGEGELFVTESAYAASELGTLREGERDDTEALKHVRNDLQIEAASIVAPDGTISASTSRTLVGKALSNPVVAFAHGQGLFAASAVPIDSIIEIDGVREWAAGDTLYVVGRPLSDGSTLLLHYDVSELLARRSRSAGIEVATMLLLAAAVALLGLSIALEFGRTRASARIGLMDREAMLLRAHGRELEEHNRELEAARRKAEEALALAEEKNRIRSEFVLMINHELRTPLTSVLTGAHLLGDETVTAADRAQILDDMVRDGHRLEQMISQILSVARIENRGLNSAVTDVSPGHVWDEVSSLLGDREIEGEPPEAREPVRTDATTLASLIRSLVDNAYQHGARHVRVGSNAPELPDPTNSVGFVPDPGMRISVSDDGPGIDPDFMPRIFEKFEKNSFSSGTGLGLYLVRLMADAIGCSVAVTSTPEGTTFVVALPRAEPAVSAAVLA